MCIVLDKNTTTNIPQIQIKNIVKFSKVYILTLHTNNNFTLNF